jgi:hypothetical protein
LLASPASFAWVATENASWPGTLAALQGFNWAGRRGSDVDRGHGLDDAAAAVVGARHDVHGETARQVPGDVAVEWPDAWVVGFELDGSKATGADSLDVTTSRVLLVADATIPGSDTFVEDVHVVAVKMEPEIC